MKRIREVWIVFALMLPGMICISCASNRDQGQWMVTLSTTSMEAIVLNPQNILDSPNQFWETDTAYALVDNWHKGTGISKDTRNYYEKWLSFLKDLSEVPEEERRDHPAFQLVEALKERAIIFEEKAIPLLNQFVPENGLKFKTTIYFTARTLPHAFATSEGIVVDVLNDYYHNDPDQIFNMITHECFHVGYGMNRYLRDEMALDNNYIYSNMCDYLQNEGLATYAAYCAQDFFPAAWEKDFKMLDDPAEVRRQLDAVNDLFANAAHMQADVLRKTSWHVGATQRGYYIVGAHMARTIDEQLGRNALIETIAVGPLAFVETYNGLVSDSLKMFVFGKSVPVPLIQDLKSAVRNNDRAAFDTIVAGIKTGGDDVPPEIQGRIRGLGYCMYRQENYEWAVALLKVAVDYFPESARSYIMLALAYRDYGNKERAVHYFNQSLKVDPDNAYAKMMLKNLSDEKEV